MLCHANPAGYSVEEAGPGPTDHLRLEHANPVEELGDPRSDRHRPYWVFSVRLTGTRWLMKPHTSVARLVFCHLPFG